MAGEALRSAPPAWRTSDSAYGKDIKLRADREAEAIIMGQLRPTGIPILSEEAGADRLLDLNSRYWVVDPLDGTFNYQRGFALWAVSIALMEGSRPLLGAIYEGLTGRCYIGGRGLGAASEDRAIGISGVGDTSQAALATGFPVGRDYTEESLHKSLARIQRFKKIRMLGSAASSLLAVAKGEFDLYLEEGICLWDVAAGLALVEGAGGDTTMSEPRQGHRYTILAGNHQLIDQCST